MQYKVVPIDFNKLHQKKRKIITHQLQEKFKEDHHHDK